MLGTIQKFLARGYFLRSSRSQAFFKIDALKNFAIFTGKHLCWSLFLIKLQAFSRGTLSKNRLQHRHFHVNIAKIFKKLFLQNTSGGCFCILQPLIAFSWKLRFGFFIKRLVQLTTTQFDIFNIKRKFFFKCLTWTFIKAWNMHAVFYEVFFISDKQTFHIMKFSNAMTSYKL